MLEQLIPSSGTGQAGFYISTYNLVLMASDGILPIHDLTAPSPSSRPERADSAAIEIGRTGDCTPIAIQAACPSF